VLTMSTRSSRSIGRPCGLRKRVPRMRAMPRFEAIMTRGASSFSSARLRNEKHSMSSICTSSMNSTYHQPALMFCFVFARGSKSAYTGDNLCLSFFSPFCNFGVNLVTKLGLNLARIAREKSKEALRAGIDNVDLMQCHSVDDFSPFLNFALWA
jgi:hypothetical protein